MAPSRREYIQQIGILLASTTVAHSAPQLEQGYPDHSRLRRCWSNLKQLEEQTLKDDRSGEKAREQLQAEHRSALDDLVKARELDTAVAAHLQSIFAAAAHHAWRSNAAITCYFVGPPYALPPQLDTDMLLLQSDSLKEIASSREIDQETLLRAQAAIEQEMVSLGHLGKLETEVPPELAQATRFLVQLLLKEEQENRQ